MIVAVGLCFHRTRLALAGAVLLHAIAVGHPGTLGLDHEPGVLAWNAFFIVQNLVLFGPWPRKVVAESVSREHAGP